MTATENPAGTTPPPAFDDPEARSVRLQGAPFWAAFVLTTVGLFVSVNQIFNLGLFGFRPVSTGYYYLMIGLFVAVGYLAFPARKGQVGVRWYDWLLAILVLASSVWMLLNAQQIIDRGWNLSAPASVTSAGGWNEIAARNHRVRFAILPAR